MENITETDLVITVIIGTLLMFIMAGVIVFSVIKYQQKVLQQKEKLRLAEKKYQNDLLEATIAASEREREKVAKNIHDEVGTLLSVISLNQRKMRKNLGNESLVIETLDANSLLLSEIMENARAIYNDLASPTLTRLGFVRAFTQLCGQINDSHENQLIFISEEMEARFDNKTEVQLFRICKELLNNILKHSASSKITVNFQSLPQLFTVSIHYNGNGINDENVKSLMDNNKGLGLKSLYSRAQVLNASINYFTETGKDARILLQLPIKTEKDAVVKN